MVKPFDHSITVGKLSLNASSDVGHVGQSHAQKPEQDLSHLLDTQESPPRLQKDLSRLESKGSWESGGAMKQHMLDEEKALLVALEKGKD